MIGLSGGGSGVPKKPRINPVVARAVGLPIEVHRGRERERGDSQRHRGGHPDDDDDDVAASPVRYTQDYSSPRGQTRQLGAARPRSSRASVFTHRAVEDDGETVVGASSEEYLKAEDEQESVAASAPVQPSSRARPAGPSSRAAAKENRLGKRDLLESAKEREGDVPVSASPKVVHASRRLLQLATPVTEGRRLGDHVAEEAAPAPVSVSPGRQGGSQKPAFLRRLDSPDSHSGKLLAAKARLTGLLQLALRLAPKLKPEAFEQTSARLVEAIKNLESGTVSP